MDNIKNVQLNPPPDSSREENMANNEDQKDKDKNKQDETGYKCGECGAIFSKKVKFCPECGTEFES